MTIEAEHRARVRFGTAVNRAAKAAPPQTETNKEFIRLGVRASAFSGGECGAVFMLVGSILGGMVGCRFTVKEASAWIHDGVWPSRPCAVARPVVSKHRKLQLERMRTFALAEMEHLGGPRDAVLNHLIEILVTSFLAVP